MFPQYFLTAPPVPSGLCFSFLILLHLFRHKLGGKHGAQPNEQLSPAGRARKPAVADALNHALHRAALVEYAHGAEQGHAEQADTDHAGKAVIDKAGGRAVLHPQDVRGAEGTGEQAHGNARDEARRDGLEDIAGADRHKQQDGHWDEHDEALGIHVGLKDLIRPFHDCAAAAAEYGEEYQRDAAGDQGVFQAVTHRAGDIGITLLGSEPLVGCGCNGHIRDGGQVIAENCTGEDRARQDCGVAAQQDSRRIQDGKHRGQGPDGGAGSRGNQTGGQECKGRKDAARHTDHVCHPDKALGYPADGHQLGKHTNDQQDHHNTYGGGASDSTQHRIPVGTIGFAKQRAYQQPQEAAHRQGVHIKDLVAHKIDHTEYQENKHGYNGPPLSAPELNRISLSLFHCSGNPLLLSQLHECGFDTLQCRHHLRVLPEGSEYIRRRRRRCQTIHRKTCRRTF